MIGILDCYLLVTNLGIPWHLLFPTSHWLNQDPLFQQLPRSIQTRAAAEAAAVAHRRSAAESQGKGTAGGLELSSQKKDDIDQQKGQERYDKTHQHED